MQTIERRIVARWSVAAALQRTLLLLFLAIAGEANGAHFEVLMIGNSYTSGTGASGAGNPSLDLQGLFNADGNHSATITQYTVGGGTLKGRVGDAAVTGPTGLIHNPANDWDVVILQERSDRPGLAIKNGGSNLTNLYAGGPVLINDHVKVSQTNAEVVLFNTWARFPGNQDLVDDFNNDPDEMQSFTNQGYDRIRVNPGFWDHSDVTSIARVGDAWQAWYDTHGFANATARLHRPDGSHQNDLGAYLSAAVLFEQITGTTSVGNAYAGSVSGNLGDESIVSLLQHQSSAITGVAAAETADFDQDFDVDGSDFLRWQEGFGLAQSAELTDGDANADAQVDNLDLGIWQAQFGSTAAASLSAQSVPEPTALHLLGVATLLATLVRRG
ncbi:MAG: DUF4886 domain-containing protein [Planctomycetota bacterium]